MKVLVLHNAYQQAGGEDAVVVNELALMRKAGYEVSLGLAYNDDIRSAWDKAQVFLRIASDNRRREWVRALLERHAPDVVHVHNFFPLLTTSVHAEAHAMNVPIVQTLHNYRLLCAGGNLERSGHVCEDCLAGSRVPAIRHRCYRNSALGSAAVTHLQRRAINQGALTRSVDRFIALTNFAVRKFTSNGIPADKIVHKPNFLDRPIRPDDSERAGALYVGRLSKEKGIDYLIRAWTRVTDTPLRVAGDGPLRAELQRIAPGNVTFLGQVDGETVEREMRRAAALVVPSVCYEGFPMAILEAYANCLPVLASRHGSLAEIVIDGVTGNHFDPADEASLAETVRGHFADLSALAQMGSNSRAEFEAKYTAEINMAQLEAIYCQAMEARSRAKA